MKKKNLIKYWIFVVIGSLFVFMNVACGSAAASEVETVPETAVPLQDAQAAAKSMPETTRTELFDRLKTGFAEAAVPTLTALSPATVTPLPAMTPTAVSEPTRQPTRPLPTIQNPANPDFVQTAESAGVPLIVVDGSNTGVWQYPEDTFIHPVAFGLQESSLQGNMAYLIDAGRVLALDLAQPAQAEILLRGGDVVDGVTVIEPLDLHVAPDGLLVLDRAGDVYRYDWQSGVWLLDWYDRPISDTSSHYYVALDGEENGRYLLETSYNYVLLYENGERQSLWNLPEARGIDLSAVGEAVYVLEQNMDDTGASLTLYESTSKVGAFRPDFPIDQARQVVAVQAASAKPVLSLSKGSVQAVYVLDQDGKRLLQFSPQDGQLQAIMQLPQDDVISAFAVQPDTGQLLFAGRNRLYFFEQPGELANVPGQALLAGIQPHDPTFLASISDFAPPIGWDITTRDLQMPGAPRHYRLGVHEGSDFYWARDSQVFAAADGVVIRAMKDYVPPFPAAFYEMRSQSYELGYTSAEALDFYRGQQVWIEHDDGLISRYIHLGSIAWDIEEGQLVDQRQFIGTVGNSGSPASLENPDSDAHLHFELWLGDHYIGQFLRPVESRDWLEFILH